MNIRGARQVRPNEGELCMMENFVAHAEGTVSAT
jgi:hypothetical protein